MFKILVMTVLIFMGMVGYDNFIGNKSEPTAPIQKQEEKAETQEKSIILGIFTSLLPPKEEWPSPVQKVFLAINMEEVINPIREGPDWTSIDAMSQDIPKALIAIEDHGFYDHGAIEIDSIIRATLANINAGEVVQGGSTITQQLAKNIFLTDEKSMGRKIEEAFLALMLESKYSKDEILELYLNTAYLGAGATGIRQAAKVYFAKTPADLTLAEAAVIASLPYAPSSLNPLENPEGCKKRQLLVLNAMLKYGMITQNQLNAAKSETVYLTSGSL